MCGALVESTAGVGNRIFTRLIVEPGGESRGAVGAIHPAHEVEEGNAAVVAVIVVDAVVERVDGVDEQVAKHTVRRANPRRFHQGAGTVGAKIRNGSIWVLGGPIPLVTGAARNPRVTDEGAFIARAVHGGFRVGNANQLVAAIGNKAVVLDVFG